MDGIIKSTERHTADIQITDEIEYCKTEALAEYLHIGLVTQITVTAICTSFRNLFRLLNLFHLLFVSILIFKYYSHQFLDTSDEQNRIRPILWIYICSFLWMLQVRFLASGVRSDS